MSNEELQAALRYALGRKRPRKEAPVPPTQEKLAVVRRQLTQPPEMDALRFRFWFARSAQGRSLDEWRAHIDSLILQEKPK